MPTECNPVPMRFARLKGRDVVADFGGGAMTSDAGTLLLGATDRAIGPVDRFSGCFSDGRSADRVVHNVATLVGQRVFGIALGYENLLDHDELRHDPVLGAVLAVWWRAGRIVRRWPAPITAFRGFAICEFRNRRIHRLLWAQIDRTFISANVGVQPTTIYCNTGGNSEGECDARMRPRFMALARFEKLVEPIAQTTCLLDFAYTIGPEIHVESPAMNVLPP